MRINAIYAYFFQEWIRDAVDSSKSGFGGSDCEQQTPKRGKGPDGCEDRSALFDVLGVMVGVYGPFVTVDADKQADGVAELTHVDQVVFYDAFYIGALNLNCANIPNFQVVQNIRAGTTERIGTALLLGVKTLSLICNQNDRKFNFLKNGFKIIFRILVVFILGSMLAHDKVRWSRSLLLPCSQNRRWM